MCGRYAASKDTASLVEEFEVTDVVAEAPPPRYNVAPTSKVPVITAGTGPDGAAARILRTARWGLVPSWAKDAAIGSRMINARWETLASKPAFRTAFARRRAILPADGYFEWYTPAVAPGSAKRPKQPYFIHCEGGASLGLAGIFEFWRPEPSADLMMSVAILTAAAQGDLRAIHDRMPVMIPLALATQWLDPTSPFVAEGPPSLKAGSLVAVPVSTAVNKVGNDFPALLDPLVCAEGPS